MEIMKEMQQAIPHWKELIKISFLSELMKKKYLNLLNERCKRLE